MSTQVGIYIYPDVEVLDFAGPYEVFTTAARVHGRMYSGAEPRFAACLIAREPTLVRARAGLEVRPDHTLQNHPPLNVLIVPGGVVTAELDRPDVSAWIAQVHDGTRITASVCTGAFLLARAGLLDGQPATTHWEDTADLRTAFPAVRVIEGPRWIDLGRIVTSAGISAGIDMSLHLVERLVGMELARATARQMDYDWQETP
jgi:transcriptional regulator GlxA family with amidase domain